jgi:uncharacterized protein YggE
MKNSLFLIIVLFTLVGHAQVISTSPNTNEKFIEVKVSDTMMVKPDIISLMVSLENSDASSDYFSSDNDEQSQEAERKRMNDEVGKKKRVEDVFKKYNVAFKFHEKKNEKNFLSKDISIYENAYEVTITNESTLEKLKKELATIDGVSAKVADTKIGDKEKYELMLIDKVMKKAEREAVVIAKSMGVTLDKPLNVSNQSADNAYSSMFNNPESMGGMGALFSMMGSMF